MNAPFSQKGTLPNSLIVPKGLQRVQRGHFCPPEAINQNRRNPNHEVF